MLRSPRFIGVVLLTTATLATVAAGLLLTSSPASIASDRFQSVTESGFEQKIGVRMTLVGLTAGGGLIDVRYQVIDPDKAAVIHTHPLILVDEKTGKTIANLFMGHSHQGELKAGYAYPLLFVNDQGVVKRSGAVSVVVGDVRLEHVSVQ